MSYHKFNENDLFYNRIEANPSINFIVYSGSVYYNNKNYESGAFSDPILHMPKGYVSLYELNVDRPTGQLIYPFITKDGSITSFRTISTTSFNTDFAYGDVISSSYPLTATISRDYVYSGDKKMDALRNTINYYKTLSPQFAFSNTARNLGTSESNLISIPSIFYGSSIKKGTIDLKFYVTGTLIAQAKDENQNGEIIQTGPVGSPGSGSTVGIALYNEGFLILTGSTALGTHVEAYPPSGIPSNPTWLTFATTGSGAAVAASSSFEINFDGLNYIPTLTMFAHAPEGMLNNSANPTFLDFDTAATNAAYQVSATSSLFQESSAKIKNTVKSPYNDPTGSFKKQTYISRIGIYDKDKNLIAIAKVATPIRKRETDSYTFKLKLDI